MEDPKFRLVRLPSLTPLPSHSLPIPTPTFLPPLFPCPRAANPATCDLCTEPSHLLSHNSHLPQDPGSRGSGKAVAMGQERREWGTQSRVGGDWEREVHDARHNCSYVQPVVLMSTPFAVRQTGTTENHVHHSLQNRISAVNFGRTYASVIADEECNALPADPAFGPIRTTGVTVKRREMDFFLLSPASLNCQFRCARCL